jgi:hypothetical protein
VYDFPVNRAAGITSTPLRVRATAEPVAKLSARPANRPASGGQVRARTRAIREVVVVDVWGRLSDVVEDLDRAIQLALADGPRGVVCDLTSALQDDGDTVAVEVLATAGRHVRDWPGIPVAVACPDHRVRDALRAHPLGGHLILTPSLFSAVSQVAATPALVVARIKLSAHPTAPRAARNFIAHTLLDWGLGRVISFASLVVGELVASSSVHAGTDIDLTITWNLGALRLTVRDHGPALPRQSHPDTDLHGRGGTVVAGLTRSLGVLPTADGGKVVWAVLEASRPHTSPRGTRNDLSSPSQTSPGFADGRGLTELPFCGGSSQHRPGKSAPPRPDAGHTSVP